MAIEIITRALSDQQDHAFPEFYGGLYRLLARMTAQVIASKITQSDKMYYFTFELLAR